MPALLTRYIASALVLTAGLISAGAAIACPFMTSAQPANIERAAAIFRGRIVAYDRLSAASADLEFAVKQTIKGEASDYWKVVWAPNAPIDPVTIDDFRRSRGGDVVVGVVNGYAMVPITIFGFTFRWPSLRPRIVQADCEDAFILRWGDEHEPILQELKARKLILAD